MIKKLKKQFVLVNMILVLLVIVPIFVFMQMSMRRDMARDSYMAIEEGLKQFGGTPDTGVFSSNDGVQSVTPNPPDDIKDPENDFKNQTFFETFYVTLDSENNIISTIARADFSIETDELNRIVNQVLEHNKVRGKLQEYNLRYTSKIFTDFWGKTYTTIGFSDTTYETMMLENSRNMYIMVIIAILVIFLLISIYLSNLMIKPIEKSWKQQQQFVSDVSHELKTPTAVILANASILSMNQDLDEDRKWVDYIDIEAKRMKKLIEDLLFLSKSDSGKNERVFSTISLDSILFDTILPFEAIIYESDKNVEINTDINEDCNILGDENQIKQLITILIDNAYKYSLPNTNINVQLYKDTGKNNATLTFNNMSDVIEKEELERLFDRFYKLDKARTREGNSYGLGLSIAKEIVANHNSKIKVKNDAENGTTFKITFPLIH